MAAWERMTFTLPPDLAKALKAEAERRMTSASSIIRDLLVKRYRKASKPK